MSTGQVDRTSAAVPSGVDGAVGVATQEELHVWKNGRRKKIDRVVIPSVVFVKCDESTRRKIVAYPFICRFMVNRSAESGTLNKPVAVIPDQQISRLRFMLGQSEIPRQRLRESNPRQPQRPRRRNNEELRRHRHPHHRPIAIRRRHSHHRPQGRRKGVDEGDKSNFKLKKLII